MEEFQERVVEEKKQLDEKIEKLELFLGSDEAGCLSIYGRGTLANQRLVMTVYSNILGRRIAEFST